MKYRLTEEFINRVRESNDLVEVASEYMGLTRNGDRYRGLCPFHKEDTPSFFVSADKQLYHCFGCGAGGNVFNFIMGIENLDFVDAVIFLADRVGLPVPEPNFQNGTDSRYKLIQKIYRVNLEAAKYFVDCLVKHKRPLDYLINRGMAMDTIRRFGLGYSPDGWDNLLRYLRSKGFSDDLIARSGLSIKRKEGSGYYDRFRNRIIFPIINVRDKVIGFGGRVLNDDETPKYLNSPETPIFIKRNNLFGLNIARKHIDKGEIIVVEGYMDVISLHQRGINNVVASLGTAFTPQQAEILKRYCKDVVIAYDADAAGQAATLKGLEILQSVGCNVRVLEIPEGKDPDEYVINHGRQEFERLIKNALSFVDYWIKLLKKKYNLKDRQQKLQFVKEAANLLANQSSEIEISEYIKFLSHSTGIYETALREEVMRIKKANMGYKRNIYGKNRYNNSAEEYKMPIKNACMEAEENVLALMLKDKATFMDLTNKIEQENFTDQFHRKLFGKIASVYDKGEAKVVDMLNLFENQQEINRIVELTEKEFFLDNKEMDKFIKDCIDTIRVNNDRQKAEYLKEQISQISAKAGRTQEEEKIYRKLCTEFVNIQRQLRGLSSAAQKGGDTNEN